MQYFVVREKRRKKSEKMRKKVLTKGVGSGILAKRSARGAPRKRGGQETFEGIEKRS